MAEPKPATFESISGKQPTRRLRCKTQSMTVDWCSSICSMQPSEVLAEAQEASASVPPEQERHSGQDHVSRKRPCPDQLVEESEQKRSRGRPAGSKNKRCMEPSEVPAGDQDYPVKASRTGKSQCISIFSKVKLFEVLGAGFGTPYCPTQCYAAFCIASYR